MSPRFPARLYQKHHKKTHIVNGKAVRPTAEGANSHSEALKEGIN